VSDTILLREQEEKVRPQLSRELSVDVPAEAYDWYEQLTYLTQLAFGKPVRPTKRVSLQGKDLEVYRRMIDQHLAEHPFLQQGRLANEVLASIVFAHAIGTDACSDSDPGVLRQASRQPFLWRSVQRFLDRAPDTWVVGSYVGFILNSLWNDAVAQAFRVLARPSDVSEGLSEITIEEPEAGWRFLAVAPIEFYEQLRNADCRLTAPVIWQGHDAQQESAVFDVRGDVTILASAGLDVRADTVRINGEARLSAKPLNQAPKLRIFMSPGARVWWGGDFVDAHPWNEYGSSLESPEERGPATKLEMLLERLVVTFPKGAPITLQKFRLRLPDDRWASWIARDFSAEKFSALIDAMIQEGAARAEASAASGPRPMVRIHFALSWNDLLEGLHHPETADSRTRRVLDRAKPLFD